MIRRVQLNIGYANRSKLRILDDIFTESRKVINDFVVKLWEKKDFRSKFVTDMVETWLSARMQQCLGKQALEIIDIPFHYRALFFLKKQTFICIMSVTGCPE